MNNSIELGDEIKFQAPLSDGGIVSWVAIVVKIDGDRIGVRHPERARNFPFSPVKVKGIHWYDRNKLRLTRKK